MPAWESVSRSSRYDPAPLRWWGEQVAGDARDALHLADHLSRLLSSTNPPWNAVGSYFGSHHPSHSFNAEPLRWLKLTEVQATRGLAAFLQDGGSDRVLAFLRALAPEMRWPRELDEAQARAEVPAGSGRIDLLVTGGSGGRRWGAVVEAKFRHHTRGNPLSDYRRVVRAAGLAVGADDDGRTAVLRIVGLSRCASTRKRLARNKDWRYLGWPVLLRRLETALQGLPDEDDFRRFRRTLWERIN